MVTLGIRIGDVRLADAQHLLEQGAISQRGLSQLGPVPSLAASDDVVDGGQGVLLVGEMVVFHGAIIPSGGQFPKLPLEVGIVACCTFSIQCVWLMRFVGVQFIHDDRHAYR